MAIKREIYTNSFQIDEIPDWTCPTCSKGAMKTDSKKLKTYENALSLSLKVYDNWEPEMMNGIFIGLLKCSNSSCNETVAITGNYHCIEGREYNNENNIDYMVVNQMLTPNKFTPPIHIFKLNENLPENIYREIVSAFSIYWVDISSCANKIRIIVELIMDDMKVAKTYIHSHSRKRHKLHKRIEIFKATKPTQAELLMAIKWIGNSGSHMNDGLTKNDILDGFEILEHVVNNLYEKDSMRITKLTKSINKRKKPIGRTKTRLKI